MTYAIFLDIIKND